MIFRRNDASRLRTSLLIGLLGTYNVFFVVVQGFCVLERCPTKCSSSSTLNVSLSKDIIDLKDQIAEDIRPTERGLSGDNVEKIDDLIKTLENQCPLTEPARSPLMGGKWIVDYSTAPPPSNGKLGPFVGIARQIIDLEDGTYVNYLSVPGDISKEWLSAKLEATFEEWDGVFLEGGNEDSVQEEPEPEEIEQPKKNENFFESFISMMSRGTNSNSKSAITTDYGASSWKVDFQSLTIKVLGITLVQQTFENTSRVWKMSYLDDDTRIVRAGRTGKDEDNMVFFMSRDDSW